MVEGDEAEVVEAGEEDVVDGEQLASIPELFNDWVRTFVKSQKCDGQFFTRCVPEDSRKEALH